MEEKQQRFGTGLGEEIFDRYQNNMSFDHPDLLHCAGQLANVLMASCDRYEEALLLLEETAAVQMNGLGPLHDSTISSQEKLERCKHNMQIIAERRENIVGIPEKHQICIRSWSLLAWLSLSVLKNTTN